MGQGTKGRRPAARRWVFPGSRRPGRQAVGSSSWYPQAQTQIEAGPPVTLPLAAAGAGEETEPSLLGSLVAWLILLGNGRHMAASAALAVGFGGPDMVPALQMRSA